MIEYGLIFLTGVLSSLHCIGMCGGIVLAYSASSAEGQLPNAKMGGVILHAAYNCGRVLSYALVGAFIGLLGGALASIRQLGDVLSIAGGVIMLVAGMAMIDVVRLPANVSLGATSTVVMKLHSSLLRRRTVRSKLLLGFLTPVLPCGILYPMMAKAAVAGSMVEGAATMAVFGLGMAPALMLLGGVSSLVSTRMKKRAEVLAAATIMILGVILILRGLHVPYLSWLSISGGEGKCPACGESVPD